MQSTVNADYADHIRTGVHIAKAEVWSLASNAKVDGLDLDLLGGTVSADRGDAMRRRATMTIADPTGSMVPTSSTDYLSPGAVGSYEVRLFRGLRWRNTSGALVEEYIQQGRFRVMDFTSNDSGDSLALDVVMVDRSDLVSQAKIEDVYIQASGLDYPSAIKALLKAQVPSLTDADFSFVTDTTACPRIVLEAGSDPWAAAIEWAKSIGCELFINAAGVFVLQPEPDPLTAPIVATYVEGAGTRLLGVNRRLTRERTRNRIIVSGESSALITQVRYTATDTDPASPTYYGGSFGKVPDFITSPLVTTSAQALAMAEAQLLKTKGLVESVKFDQIVDARHEVGDMVTIVRARAGVASNFIMERMQMPLFGASMPADTRERVAA